MTFSPTEFVTMCEQILGGNFLEPLSEILDVNPRTIQRWVSGAQPVPAGVEQQIRDQHRLIQEIDVRGEIVRAMKAVEARGVWRQAVIVQARAAIVRFQGGKEGDPADS